ncbi:hypothetical protein CFC21_060048 [Triticum aestivum]|uniref:Uncharacterized protein n=2 Tax=Triticum aestivum TaxID=4565 RepID=A0A3B6JBR2_WHEAT|nr:hypothetical protein CFC21_060048 [Triticum aestivum]
MTDTAYFSFNVEAGEVWAAAAKGRRWVEYLVFAVGLVTASMSVALAIYKVPAGVFVEHRPAYYASVVVAGVIGLAEACTAVLWLSAGAADGPPQGQRFARRCVMCASLLPLVFMAGLGGVRILVK